MTSVPSFGTVPFGAQGAADKRTAALFAGHAVRGLPHQIEGRARAKLQSLDAAKRLDNLRVPPGNRLERSAAARFGQHSIRINDPWRICFAWGEGEVRTSKSSTTTEGKAMTIRREELDAGEIDLKGVTTGKRIPPAHPGEILRHDFLEPMGLSVYALANATRVPRSRVNDIVRGRRAMTADTALRLARYFGTTPEFWINLQARYDLEAAEETSRRRIEKEVEPHAA